MTEYLVAATYGFVLNDKKTAEKLAKDIRKTDKKVYVKIIEVQTK